MTFPPGNSLHGFQRAIDRCRAAVRPVSSGRMFEQREDAEMIALSEAPGPQGSPFVQAANINNARFALDKIPPEYMADFLATYLAGRFGRAKASLIGGNVARNAETGK